MQKGDIWKDGGEMEDYQAMSKFANDNGLMFARNNNGDFEIMPQPEFVQEDMPKAEDKDAKITALEQRLGELEAVLASLISPISEEQTAEPQEGEGAE